MSPSPFLIASSSRFAEKHSSSQTVKRELDETLESTKRWQTCLKIFFQAFAVTLRISKNPV